MVIICYSYIITKVLKSYVIRGILRALFNIFITIIYYLNKISPERKCFQIFKWTCNLQQIGLQFDSPQQNI